MQSSVSGAGRPASLLRIFSTSYTQLVSPCSRLYVLSSSDEARMRGVAAVLGHYPLLDVGILDVLEDGTLEGLLPCFFPYLPDIGPPGFARGP